MDASTAAKEVGEMKQVKAFMSERGFRSWGMIDGVSDMDASWVDKSGLADRAEREARAILGETEPDFDVMIGHHSQASWQMLGASALASALAAFVEGC